MNVVQKEFDYIIVGAGSAGCVLAERLSKGNANQVLVIEAGPKDNDPFIHMPMGLFRTFSNPKRTWAYILKPDPTSGKQHFWLRGKMVGGSSSINGMLYFRGQPQDYDDWEALGCRGWGWAAMLQAFRAIEDHELGDDGVRGSGGPLHISVQKRATPLTEALLQAGASMGLPIREDLNRPDQEGIGYSPCTMNSGVRVSAADAFLKPALPRRNLHLIVDTLVTKIEFSNQRAVAVVCLQGNEQQRFSARKEVIVAAGALQSPALLQHSGIGDAQRLRALGIQVVKDSPDVGMNAREHKTITLTAKVAAHSLNRELRGLRKYLNGMRYFASHTGPMAATYDINAFIRTRSELKRPDAQLTFWCLSPDRTRTDLLPEADPGLTFMGYPLRTESKGEVWIDSPDPRALPAIQANFLSTDYDRRVIVDMFRYVRRLFAQPALAAHIMTESHPGASVETDEEVIAACHQDSTCFHTVGTCRMGADANSVVDDRLRVRGVLGLRVVDCSVMPTQVSGNTNGPVTALAWRAADLILAGE